MTSDDRAFQLRLSLLNELSACNGIPCPARALANAMYAAVTPAPTRAEIDEAVAWLEREGHVAGLPGALGAGRKWSITDKGRLALHA
jgi:hypothetical protein